MRSIPLLGRPFIKKLFIAVIPLLLAGCAAPAAHQIAGWVADSLLYLKTGKSASDHAISIAMKQDCAMWRWIWTKPYEGIVICSDHATPVNDDIMVASNSPTPQPFGHPVHTVSPRLLELAATPSVKPVPGQDNLPGVNTFALDSSDNKPRQLAALPMADDSMPHSSKITVKNPAITSKRTVVRNVDKETSGTPSRYLVLGSFRNFDNAEALSKTLTSFKVVIISTKVRGDTYHRVVARPSPGENLAELRMRYGVTGAKSWVVTLSEPITS